jgi:hypothetical protein
MIYKLLLSKLPVTKIYKQLLKQAPSYKDLEAATKQAPSYKDLQAATETTGLLVKPLKPLKAFNFRANL